MFLCTLATKRAKISISTAKLQKWGVYLRFSSSKPYPMFKDFSQKSDLLERHTPVCLTPRVPPPPPPPGHKTLWARDPVINEGRFWYPVSMCDDHIRPIWYPVPMVMTTIGRFDTLCQYWWPVKTYPVQRHVPITFHNGGAPPPPGPQSSQ